LVPEKPVKVISEEDFEPVCWHILIVHNKAEPDYQENPNEIVVGLNTNIDEHVAKAVGLLEVSRVVLSRRLPLIIG